MNKNFLYTRIFSFVIPGLMDGILGLVQTSLPLVAIRFGVNAEQLSRLGYIPQCVRFFFCLGGGHISDKAPRPYVMVPALCVIIFALLGLIYSKNLTQLIILYTFILASYGFFYPALQSYIGERSGKGELRKNLSMFNLSWSIGGALCALSAAFLLAIAFEMPFITSILLAISVIACIVFWSRASGNGDNKTTEQLVEISSGNPGMLLPIARIAHFMSFFSYGITRNIFPLLARNEMKLSEEATGILVGSMLVGQAIGMLSAASGSWWRNRVAPLLAGQALMIVVSLSAGISSNYWIFLGSFVLHGFSLGIVYTGALYYGLQSRENMGKNTGIHEGIVAAAIVSGSFIGGLLGQYINLRAPYIFGSAITVCGLLFSMYLWYKRKHTV